MYIGFSRPKRHSTSSSIIQSVLGTDYSHVFLVFDVPLTGQRVVYQATAKGVHCLEYNTFLEDNTVIEEIYISDQEAAKDALEFCIKSLGKPYSVISLFFILLNIKFGDGSRSFICSELVARALKLPLKRLDLVTPRDIKEYYEKL